MTTNARIGLATHQATVERMESLGRGLKEAGRRLSELRNNNGALNKCLTDTKERLKRARATIDSQGATITRQGQTIRDGSGQDTHSNLEWSTRLVAEIEQTKKKLFASRNSVKVLEADRLRIMNESSAAERNLREVKRLLGASEHSNKKLNKYLDELERREDPKVVSDDKLLLDLQKGLIEKQDKSIDGLKQDIRDYKTEIDRLTKLLSQPRPDWRDHTIKTQEIRIKELSDLITELRQGVRDHSRVSTGQGIRIKELSETIYNLEQQLATTPLDGATEKMEAQGELIYKLQRESGTTYREKENLLTKLSSKDRRIKKLEAILVRFGFIYNEEKN